MLTATTSIDSATTSLPSLNHPSLDAPIQHAYSGLIQDAEGNYSPRPDLDPALTPDQLETVHALLAANLPGDANALIACGHLYQKSQHCLGDGIGKPHTVVVHPTHCGKLICREDSSGKGRAYALANENPALYRQMISADSQLLTLVVKHSTAAASPADTLSRIRSTRAPIRLLRRKLSARPGFKGEYGMVILPELTPHATSTTIQIYYQGPRLQYSWLKSLWESCAPAGSWCSIQSVPLSNPEGSNGLRALVRSALSGLVAMLLLPGAARVEWLTTFKGFRLMQSVGTFRGLLAASLAAELPAESLDDASLDLPIGHGTTPCPHPGCTRSLVRCQSSAARSMKEWAGIYESVHFGHIHANMGQAITTPLPRPPRDRHGPN